MNTLYDLDFAKLYQQHLQQCHYHGVSASKWDKKAEKFAENVVESPYHYTHQFLDYMTLSPSDTVLDIGCGPGTLALPLARRCQQVYALDFSLGMLERLKKYQQQFSLSNIHTLHKSWEACWDDVPQADIVIASRSTLVGNLADAVEKIIAKAKKRVYLTAIVDKHFLDERIFSAIGRSALGFPTYIYLLNDLYQRGIEAEVRFIEGCAGQFEGDYDALETAVEFSLGALNQQEKQKLAEWYQYCQATHSPIKQGQRKWAMLSWKVE